MHHGAVDEIEEFGLLAKALVRDSDRRINDLLRPLGLTTGQAEALQLLDRYGPLSLGQLGRPADYGRWPSEPAGRPFGCL